MSAFLKAFKLIVAQERGLDVIPRVENRDALIRLGLTERNRRQEILSLSVEDYCSGPEDDINRPGKVWVFGKKVAGKETYIKLKIAQVAGRKIAKCLSFHEAKHPMSYPFREPQDDGSE